MRTYFALTYIGKLQYRFIFKNRPSRILSLSPSLSLLLGGTCLRSLSSQFLSSSSSSSFLLSAVNLLYLLSLFCFFQFCLLLPNKDEFMTKETFLNRQVIIQLNPIPTEMYLSRIERESVSMGDFVSLNFVTDGNTN